MSESVEQRLRKLENKLTYLTGLAVAAGAFLGFTYWKTIPSAVETAVVARVTPETLARIERAEAAAGRIIEADLINDVKSSLRWETLRAELEGPMAEATFRDDSAIYLHILQDPSCFLVTMRLPTADENPQWLSGTGEQLVFGTTREARTGQPSGNFFPRYRVSSNSLSSEAIRIFSLVTVSETPIKLPQTVNFRALLSCPKPED